MTGQHQGDHGPAAVMPQSAPRETPQEQAAEWFARSLHDGTVLDSPAFHAWRSADGANAAAYDALGSLWRSDAFGAALAASVPRPSSAAVPGRRPVRPVWMAMAAAVAVAVSVTVLADGLRHAAVDRMQALFADHATGVGERRTVALPDGSRITLDSGSAVDVTATPAGPRVTVLAGEAYFEVQPVAAGQSFTVRTGDAEVRVVGTAFTVRDGSGAGTDVSVAHGTVAVRSQRSGESVRLEAGQAAAVSPTGRVTAAAADPDGFAWVAGRIQFHDRPLRAVLADLDRYIPGFVVLLDDDLGDRPVSGSYRLDDPRAVVRALAEVVGARVETLGDHLIFVRS
ncbi:FecR family protein [Caenispirillum bisanense]|uniref:FecR family protein n=1 Tax=Caenispirillum bisanense TaxID=414052 RepID=A0A286GK91_9PROT|nr:FecR domain-containing protein [Caenispirillum bisanense]SOD95957.1 FecR family protein [Caenispirillum bisanense]